MCMQDLWLRQNSILARTDKVVTFPGIVQVVEYNARRIYLSFGQSQNFGDIFYMCPKAPDPNQTSGVVYGGSISEFQQNSLWGAAECDWWAGSTAEGPLHLFYLERILNKDVEVLLDEYQRKYGRA